MAAARATTTTSSQLKVLIEFLSAGYDSLSAFRKEAKEQLQGLTTKLNCLVEQVGEIAEAIDAIDRYSYQNDVKVVGIPEVNSRESALETSTLCVKLLEALGVEIPCMISISPTVFRPVALRQVLPRSFVSSQEGLLKTKL